MADRVNSALIVAEPEWVLEVLAIDRDADGLLAAIDGLLERDMTPEARRLLELARESHIAKRMPALDGLDPASIIGAAIGSPVTTYPLPPPPGEMALDFCQPDPCPPNAPASPATAAPSSHGKGPTTSSPLPPP